MFIGFRHSSAFFFQAVSEDDGIAMEQEDTSREVLKETPNLEAKVGVYEFCSVLLLQLLFAVFLFL